MTLKEYKKIERGLNLVIGVVEKQATVERIDPLSPEYEMILDKAEEQFFMKAGASSEEFNLIKEEMEGKQEAALKEVLKTLERNNGVLEKLNSSVHILTTEEVADIAGGIIAGVH